MEPKQLMIPTISDEPQIDERRALLMSMQALLDPKMLKVVATLQAGERPFKELSDELGQRPSFSRGPLGRLITLELVEVRNENGRLFCRLNHERLYVLNGALQRLSRDLLAAPERTAASDAAEGMDELERRTLRKYLQAERIVHIPEDPQRLQVVLRWLVTHFETEQSYAEREVNQIISRHHDDFATLRRALVDYRLMTRENNIYRRI